MYVIVTCNKELADLAKAGGDDVFQGDVRIQVGDFSPSKNDKLDKTILKTLNEFAIRSELSGFRYIRYILEQYVAVPNYVTKSITKEVYPQCARQFGTTPSRIERAVRHAINSGFGLVPEAYFELYGRVLPEAPTNSSFLATMAVYITELLD